jgi:hypothetical protein
MKLFTNAIKFNASISKFAPARVKKQQTKIEDVAWFIHYSLLAKTPVYSGSTVANYQWTVGSPFQGTVTPVESPASGWGGTNQKGQGPLGPEKRRGANEEIATASLRRINFKASAGQQLYLVNNDPTFQLLEFGQVPFNPPNLLPRSPQGMLGITLSELRTRLESGTLKVQK